MITHAFTHTHRPHNAVEVRVVAPSVMGSAGGVGRDGGGGGHRPPQGLQTLLVPHVRSPRTTAVRGGQVERRPTLVAEDHREAETREFNPGGWFKSWS